MKQVSHAEKLVEMLQQNTVEDTNKKEDENELLDQLITAQLSHSDGIRGFFVTYLTSESSPVADQPTVPPSLLNAMKQVDPTELVPLACKFFFCFNIIIVY